MIKLCAKLPEKFVLALSGGVDSMVAHRFFSQGKKNFISAFYHHNTQNSEAAFSFLKESKIEFQTEKLNDTIPVGESPENFWRIKRYEFLNSFNLPIVTAHHLDDAVESWIISTLVYANPKVMKIQDGNRIKPFLKTRKSALISFAERNGVKWIEDTSNQMNTYKRNFIRNEMMQNVLTISPGIHTLVSKKIT